MATIADRFKTLDTLRWNKLERARYCASLTVPSLMPPEGWTEQYQLPQPFSSVSARGVTSMASRMLSALLPLNDMPFFKFELSAGQEPDFEVDTYLERLSYQVFNKLSSGNLRETIYQALQHLIVVGDVMLIMEDDMNFRVVRLDRYVCRRDVYGDVEEVVFVEYEAIPDESDEPLTGLTYMENPENKLGYREIYCRILKQGDRYIVTKEDKDGNTVVGSGEYTVPPYVLLRFAGVSGENYGRSHCEDIIGDIKSLEGFTEGLINGIAAGSLFWMGIEPNGFTEVDDIAGSPSGSFVSSRPNEVFTISPAATMNPQIQATQQGVEILRRELGKAFLMDSASIPKGERVTATAVRMVGQELENVLGGAFSAIARDLMVPVVNRAVFVMTSQGEIDERVKDLFTDQEGVLNVAILTGLQALSRDTDLQKLMQMGEMVRNLPEQAAMMFRWDEYGKALITSLGFDPNSWVKSQEDVMQEQMQIAQAEGQIQGQQQTQQNVNNAITQGAMQAAMQDVEQTGGKNIQQMIGGMGQ